MLEKFDQYQQGESYKTCQHQHQNKERGNQELFRFKKRKPILESFFTNIILHFAHFPPFSFPCKNKPIKQKQLFLLTQLNYKK